MFDITNIMQSSFDKQLKMISTEAISSNDSILSPKSKSAKKKRPRADNALKYGKLSAIKEKLRGTRKDKQIVDTKASPCSFDGDNDYNSSLKCKIPPSSKPLTETDDDARINDFFAKYGMERIVSIWVTHRMKQNATENGKLLSSLPVQSDATAIMFNKDKPDLTIEQYISRLVTYSGVDDVVFMFALIYLERIKHENDALTLCEANANRLLAIAIPVAAKYVQDFVYPINFHRKIAGIETNEEMSCLEVTFLSIIGFNLFVSQDELHAFIEAVEAVVEEKVPKASSPISDVIDSIMNL